MKTEKLTAYLQHGDGGKDTNEKGEFRPLPRRTEAVPVMRSPMRHHRANLSYTATGYGERIPTEYMARWCNRWRRVYCRIFSNSGTLYIRVPSATDTEFAQFLAGHNDALLWSSTDTVDGEDVNLDDFELSAAGADECRADCLDFFTANHADLATAADCDGYSWAHAGHDFALTRNGHGAGYWDGDLPEELGERLTEASKAAGEACAYIGDDGAVYL